MLPNDKIVATIVPYSEPSLDCNRVLKVALELLLEELQSPRGFELASRVHNLDVEEITETLWAHARDEVQNHLDGKFQVLDISVPYDQWKPK